VADAGAAWLVRRSAVEEVVERSGEVRFAVTRLLQSLPATQRGAFMLREVLGFSAADTAAVLAYGRVTGKALGKRTVSGDLTGLARIKFDDAAHRLGLRRASPRSFNTNRVRPTAAPGEAQADAEALIAAGESDRSITASMKPYSLAS